MTADIELSKEERDDITRKIMAYVEQELETDITGLQADFLLDFLAKEVGPSFYNRALYDAQAILSKRLDEVNEAILDLEKHAET